jgi:hypothetical protein
VALVALFCFCCLHTFHNKKLIFIVYFALYENHALHACFWLFFYFFSSNESAEQQVPETGRCVIDNKKIYRFYGRE